MVTEQHAVSTKRYLSCGDFMEKKPKKVAKRRLHVIRQANRHAENDHRGKTGGPLAQQFHVCES